MQTNHSLLSSFSYSSIASLERWQSVRFLFSLNFHNICAETDRKTVQNTRSLNVIQSLLHIVFAMSTARSKGCKPGGSGKNRQITQIHFIATVRSFY